MNTRIWTADHMARVFATLRRHGWSFVADDWWVAPDGRDADGSEALEWAERAMKGM